MWCGGKCIAIPLVLYRGASGMANRALSPFSSAMRKKWERDLFDAMQIIWEGEQQVYLIGITLQKCKSHHITFVSFSRTKTGISLMNREFDATTMKL